MTVGETIVRSESRRAIPSAVTKAVTVKSLGNMLVGERELA